MKQHEHSNCKKPPIRTLLTVMLTAFVTLGLLLMLLTQTVFMDDLYRLLKIRTIKIAANDMVQALANNETEQVADYWSVREECDIYIVNHAGDVEFAHGMQIEGFHYLSSGQLRAYYDTASSGDGTVFAEHQINIGVRDEYDEKPPKEEKPGGDREPPKSPKNLSKATVGEQVLYAVLTESEDGTAPRMVLVTTTLNPVRATVRVVQIQMLLSMVLFVVLAVLLARFTAKGIASPIANINRAAKNLPKGTYQPPAEGRYREIEELRETLTEINVELRKSEQLQRELIANVSHDIRTPLTMIIGYGEAIRDLPGEDSAENIQVVIDEAERLSQLVNDVLDLSKLQSGVEQFELVPTKLTESLCAAVQRVGRMTQTEGYHIELIAPQDVTVMADEVRLSQIIYNLLTNALAHTGQTKTVSVEQTVKENCVRVSFTDSGKGIPEEELSNIWLRYYQVHSHERRRDTMNSGLGLSIVYALVRHHGGTCGVESTLGKGSTFWFELPLA